VYVVGASSVKIVFHSGREASETELLMAVAAWERRGIELWGLRYCGMALSHNGRKR